MIEPKIPSYAKKPVASAPSKTKEEIENIVETFEKDIPLKALFRAVDKDLFEWSRKEDKIYLKKYLRYDKEHDSVVVLIYNHKDELISFKHQCKKGREGKWITCAGTSPNKTSIHRNVEDPPHSVPCLIIEGHHDFLNAILLGVDFICMPTESYTLNRRDIAMLTKENREVIYIPDIKAEGLNKYIYPKNTSKIENILEESKIDAISVNLFKMVGEEYLEDSIDLSDAISFYEDVVYIRPEKTTTHKKIDRFMGNLYYFGRFGFYNKENGEIF